MPQTISLGRGSWLVIRADGSQEHHEWKGGRASIAAIHKAIGCDCCDTVVLSKSADTMEAKLVMLVDDTGMIDGKPVNRRATELYRQVRQTPYSIHGDVAICRDEDFI